MYVTYMEDHLSVNVVKQYGKRTISHECYFGDNYLFVGAPPVGGPGPARCEGHDQTAPAALRDGHRRLPHV